MRALWTPWRMEHVSQALPRPRGCLFDPPADTFQDRDLLLLFAGDRTVVLLNRFPYANGHLLVAPRRHAARIEDLDRAEQGALMAMLGRCTGILDRHLSPGGYNIGLNLGGCAGAGIPDHLHFHVVPRWEGDHNFITVLAEVRTIPEHILAAFDRLAPDFAALPRKEDP